jgi:hypothetical protein
VGEILKYKLLIVMGICLALLLVTTVNANPLDDLFNLLFGGGGDGGAIPNDTNTTPPAGNETVPNGDPVVPTGENNETSDNGIIENPLENNVLQNLAVTESDISFSVLTEEQHIILFDPDTNEPVIPITTLVNGEYTDVVTQKQDAQEAVAFTENSGTTIIRSR